MSHASIGRQINRSIAADQFKYRPGSTEQLAYLSRTSPDNDITTALAADLLVQWPTLTELQKEPFTFQRSATLQREGFLTTQGQGSLGRETPLCRLSQ
jgi:hypothetical protein